MVQAAGVFRRSDQQVSCKINDEVAILHLGRSLYFGLQGTAVQIWDALEQPRSVPELCDCITSEFDVAPARCEADVTELLGSLQAEGLIEVVAVASADER